MGKLLCDPSAAAVAEALPPPSPAPAPPLLLLAWSSPAPSLEPSTSPTGWDAVWALEDQQRRRLHQIWERGVAWKPSSASTTGSGTAAASKADARELRHRAVRRFAEVYTAAGEDDKAAIDAAVRHLYAPPSRSSLISASKGTTTRGSALARCSLLAQIFYLIFSPDLAPELAARWLDARKTKMEETGFFWGRCWRREDLGA